MTQHILTPTDQRIRALEKERDELRARLAEAERERDCWRALYGREPVFSTREMVRRGDVAACEERGKAQEKYVAEVIDQRDAALAREDAALKDVAALRDNMKKCADQLALTGAPRTAHAFETALASPHPGAEWFDARLREVAERAWDDGYSAGSAGSTGAARRRDGIDGAMEKS